MHSLIPGIQAIENFIRKDSYSEKIVNAPQQVSCQQFQYTLLFESQWPPPKLGQAQQESGTFFTPHTRLRPGV
jgi:hypothetical protein